MAEHLPVELWSAALKIARQSKDESDHSLELSIFAKYIPPELLPEVSEAIWLIQDKYYCVRALNGFLPHLEELSTSFDKWSKVLDILAYQNRAGLLNVLPDSRPIIVTLGDEQAFLDTLQAMRDVCRQWP